VSTCAAGLCSPLVVCVPAHAILRHGSAGLMCLLAVLVCGCEFRVPSPTYINETKLIAVKGEVAQLGVLHPDRVGVPFAAPIVEAMPGDRFAFEAVVVDPNGKVLGAGEVESIWFQCGVFDCGVGPAPLDGSVFDLRCDELEMPSLDARCRLGEGDARFEFQMGALAELIVTERVAVFYGVIAWDGRSAEDCWAARQAENAEFDGCAFTQRSVKIGPSWWMLAYAEAIGIPSPIPIWQIPAAVYAQPANRTPSPLIAVTVDGKLLGAYPETTQFTAKLGDSIHLDIIYDEIEQQTQFYFFARFNEESQVYWFQLGLEYVLDTMFTTGSIHVTGGEDYMAKRDFVIDEYAEPGSAQIFVVYADDRYGEGVARLDFEVEH
jgi:hypothetical protein